MRDFLAQYRNPDDYAGHLNVEAMNLPIGSLSAWEDVREAAETSFVDTAYNLAAASDEYLLLLALGCPSHEPYEEAIFRGLSRYGLVQTPEEAELLASVALSHAAELVAGLRDLNLGVSAATHARVASGRYTTSPFVSNPSLDQRFGSQGVKAANFFFAADGWSANCNVYASDIPGFEQLNTAVSVARNEWVEQMQNLTEK